MTEREEETDRLNIKKTKQNTQEVKKILKK